MKKLASNHQRRLTRLPGRLLRSSLLLPPLLLAAAGCVGDEPALEDEDSSMIGAELSVSADTIQMPIEVLGRSGTKKSVRFNVSDTSNITHLYLRCNSCGYEDVALNRSSKVKATVIVNGTRIPLKHFTEKDKVYGSRDIQIVGGEKDYGGIGGAFRTVRILVPVKNIRSGSNTIELEHTSAVAPSIGFRIIEMNLIRGGDLKRTVLPSSTFTQDNPRTWTAPISGDTAVKQGEALWKKRGALYDPGIDLLDGKGSRQGPVTGVMQAACADCHAADGRDLKYFNFSNESIVQRALFHELSQEQGKQLASYIRTRKLAIVDQARPWNPTYQPGKGLDQRSAYEWAAGAGLGAILDRDSDMKEILFGKSPTLDSVKKVVNRNGTLNLRELPINIPMPEWNQWLPLIHPDDAFDERRSAITSDHDGKSVGQPYYRKLYSDAVGGDAAAIGRISVRLNKWLARGLTCSTQGKTAGEPIRALNGPVMTALKLPIPFAITESNCDSIVDDDSKRNQLKNLEHAKRGLMAWASVKTWEIIHGRGLETESTKQGTYSEARGWVVSASDRESRETRNVFERPPHFTGVGRGRQFFNQNEMQGIFESNVWYHLNMILSPGYRKTQPSHFAYTYSHVELLHRYSKIPQGFRFWATLIKQRQLQTSGIYGTEEGLDLRTAQPYIYYGTGRDNPTSTGTHASVGKDLWRYLAQAMLDDFAADVKNATWDDWTRNGANLRKVQPKNSSGFKRCGSGGCKFELIAEQGSNTFKVIPLFRTLGVASGTLERVIEWGKYTWPNNDWNSLKK